MFCQKGSDKESSDIHMKYFYLADYHKRANDMRALP